MCLTISVVLSVMAMFTLSLLYDMARSAADGTVPRTWLWPAILLACSAQFTFLLGFAYLGRLTYYL
jgi:hypothetical protein